MLPKIGRQTWIGKTKKGTNWSQHHGGAPEDGKQDNHFKGWMSRSWSCSWEGKSSIQKKKKSLTKGYLLSSRHCDCHCITVELTLKMSSTISKLSWIRGPSWILERDHMQNFFSTAWWAASWTEDLHTVVCRWSSRDLVCDAPSTNFLSNSVCLAL